MAQETSTLLIENGRVYDHDGDTDLPPVADILVIADRIAAVEVGIGERLRTGTLFAPLGERRLDRIIDARDRLVIPGFFNGHYHSHDTLLKGSFESLPLELWALYALPPSYPRRSREELRARTLIGAVECLRGGITTVQDMDRIHPFTPEDLDVVLEAYDEVGIRCVFAPHFNNLPALDGVPFWRELIPADDQWRISSGVPLFPDDIDIVSHLEGLIGARRGRYARIGFALGPSAPERCSRDLLERVADLSARESLPVYTHVYESRAMTLHARQDDEFDRSHIRYLAATGLLGPRLTLAHSIWLLDAEIALLAETGTSVALNPVGNLKTRSGVAPIKALKDLGINIGLGCDNCSCSDVQNMFQAMKLFTTLGAVEDPDPGPPYARDAIWAATMGGAKSAGLDHEVGALKPGMKADLVILDLTDPSYVPLNSVARQLVFTEAGRSVETVVVDGRIVMENDRVRTVDEAALRRTVEAAMVDLRKDMGDVRARIDPIRGYLDEAYRRTWAEDIGVHRYLGAARPQGDGS